jgi:hypothetical protein
MNKKLKLAVLAAALAGASFGAQASLINLGELSTDLTAQGFGNAPRLLTLQAESNNTTESTAIGVSGGAMTFMTPGILDSQVFMGNGYRNLGGDTVSGNNKYDVPTLSELGWTTGSNVNLLFNATEPGGDGVTVTDVTLKFYSGNTVIAAIDGNFSIANTNTGNGVAGFLIGVDATQQTYLNNTVFNQAGYGDFRIALESTITGVAGGAESFSALTTAVPEPQTYAMMLAGLGLMGFVGRRRARKQK